MQQRLEHTFGVDPKRFWQIFLFDERYERDLYDHLELTIEHKSLTREGEGPDLRATREIHLTPDRNIPGVLKRLIRGTTLVKERGYFDAGARRMEIQVELPVIGPLVSFGGVYSWPPGNDSPFTRTWEAYCTTKIPLVGHQVERYLLGEVEESQRKAYEFTRHWLQ